MKIILASASPRRQVLLANAGFDFETIPADIDETPDPSLNPEQLVASLAEQKCQAVFNIMPDGLVIGADTVVAIDGLILGKPSSKAEAFEMLKRLQGRQHTVYTGVNIKNANKSYTFVESTKVYMRSLNDDEINNYIATGEPMDKAGSYGIQERGATLIEKIEGDYFTVVGLPLCRLSLVLKGFEI